MSVTIDLFFNHPKPLAELGTEINACLGCSLVHTMANGEDLLAQFMGSDFSPGDTEGCERDKELDCESYACWIGFRSALPDWEMRPAMLPAMMLVVYALHHCLGITGILVYEMQTLLARYEEQEVAGYGRRLYDVSSGMPFVDFTQHLEILLRRLPGVEERYFARPET